MIGKIKVRAWIWGVLFVLSGLVILSTSFTIFRASGFYYTIAVVAIALNVGLFGASFIRAGLALRKVSQREEPDVTQVLAVLPHFAPPFVIQIILIVMISFFVAVVFAIGVSDIEHARYRAQKQHLDTLRAVQTRYFTADHDRDGRPDSIYADGLSKLKGFETRWGVHVAITHGSRNGWAAISSHEALAGDQGCAIFVGNVPDVPMTLGGRREQEPGSVYCDE